MVILNTIIMYIIVIPYIIFSIITRKLQDNNTMNHSFHRITNSQKIPLAPTCQWVSRGNTTLKNRGWYLYGIYYSSIFWGKSNRLARISKLNPILIIVNITVVVVILFVLAFVIGIFIFLRIDNLNILWSYEHCNVAISAVQLRSHMGNKNTVIHISIHSQIISHANNISILYVRRVYDWIRDM